MRKLLATLILATSLSFSIDFVTPVFYYLGADQSQMLHCVFSEKLVGVMEDNLGWNIWQSLAATYVLGEVKEQIDIAKGSYRNPKDVEWTMYGWVFKRFLTWEFKFDFFIDKKE